MPSPMSPAHHNPLHSDADYAARTRFKQPIAHGMLGAGVISAALGTKIAPDSVVIYLGQNLQFRAPVAAGDTITAAVTVNEVDPDRSIVKLDTNVLNQEGVEVIPRRRDDHARSAGRLAPTRRGDAQMQQPKTQGETAGDGEGCSPNGRSVSEAQTAWEAGALARLLDRYPERRERFASSSAETKRLYTSADTEDVDYLDDIGFPGEYPFTRGVQPSMYRGRLWTMRQYAGFGTAEDTNQRFRHLIENGQTGLSTAFDLPTQTGYDSDDPMALGEVGQVGVAIDSLADMETLFNDIPLDKISSR